MHDPAAIDPAAELAAARQLAHGGGCVTWNAAATLVDAVEGDLGVDDMAVATGGTGSVDTILMTGQLFDSRGGSVAFTLIQDDHLADIHAMLLFNHLRTYELAAAYQLAGLQVEFQSRPTLLSPEEDGSLVAAWDGSTVSFADGEESALSPFDMSPALNRDAAVGDAAADLARFQVDEWLQGLRPMLAEPRGVVALEGSSAELEGVRELLCVLFATEWTAADAAIAGHEEDAEWLRANATAFLPELRVHELMLLGEYLDLITDYMNRPEIDWFRAPSVDMSQMVDGVTSATEFVELWRYGAADALARYDALS